MFKLDRQLAAAVLLAASTQASAGLQPVIEINNPPALPGAGVGLPHTHYQQSFAASKDGLLSGFGIFGDRDATHLTATVLLKVGGGAGWQSGGWTAEIHPRLDGTLVDLSSFNLFVKAGDRIVFDVGQSSGSVWMMRHGLGELYSKPDNSAFPFLHEERSLAFTSWLVPGPVQPEEPDPPNAVPAPGAGVLMLLGLGMLGVARRFARPALC